MAFYFRSKYLRVRTVGLLASIFIGSAGGTCNDQQTEECRIAAGGGSLRGLQSGGECTARPYNMEFTHLCTVFNYLPTVDYCCCTYNTDVMCCRYHQTWNNFRCERAADVIDNFYGGGLANSDGCQSDGCSTSLRVLLPSILVPLLLLLCCATIIIRTWLRHRKHRAQRRYAGHVTSSHNDILASRKNETDNGRLGGCENIDSQSLQPIVTASLSSPRVFRHVAISVPIPADSIRPHPRERCLPRNHLDDHHEVTPTSGSLEPSAPPLDDDIEHHHDVIGRHFDAADYEPGLLNSALMRSTARTGGCFFDREFSVAQHGFDSREVLRYGYEQGEASSGASTVCPTCSAFTCAPPPPYDEECRTSGTMRQIIVPPVYEEYRSNSTDRTCNNVRTEAGRGSRAVRR